jgi:hypothetical protein
VNAATDQQAASSASANWFRRPQDGGTPIFDQLSAERLGVVDFMHTKIPIELDWPAPPADSPSSIPDFGFTGNEIMEGSDSDD